MLSLALLSLALAPLALVSLGLPSPGLPALALPLLSGLLALGLLALGLLALSPAAPFAATGAASLGVALAEPALDAVAPAGDEPPVAAAGVEDAALALDEVDPVELLPLLSRRRDRRWEPPLPAPPFEASVPEVALPVPCWPEADGVCCSS